MRFFLYFLTILFLAFFQTVVWDYFNFLLVLILTASLLFSASRALLLAYLAGLFLDLFSGMRLGLSSLSFLLPSFLLTLYRQRFSFQNPILIFIMAFGAAFLFSLTSGQAFNPLEAILLACLMIVFRFLFPFLFKSEEEQEQFKLKV